MRLIKPGWKTLRMGITPWEQVDGGEDLKIIEQYGRKCYKSEDKITAESAPKFVNLRIQQGHIALLDHLHVTAEYISDRGVSHEWLRHKLTEILGSGHVRDGHDWTPMAVCQESTRYCNYMSSGGVTFIIPPWVNIPEGDYGNSLTGFTYPEGDVSEADQLWFDSALNSEMTYLELLRLDWTPQMARGELLIKTKTEFIVTCSLTEWRHVFSQRTAAAAHPQMR
jgi:thymidylate synthase (FAD)